LQAIKKSDNHNIIASKILLMAIPAFYKRFQEEYNISIK